MGHADTRSFPRRAIRTRRDHRGDRVRLVRRGLVEFGVESAFGVDALGAGLLARVLADRHFRVPVDGGYWGRLGGWGRGVDGPVGKQDLAEGCGLVDVAGRRCPGVAAVGVLNIGPAALAGLKRLEQVVIPTGRSRL